MPTKRAKPKKKPLIPTQCGRATSFIRTAYYWALKRITGNMFIGGPVPGYCSCEEGPSGGDDFFCFRCEKEW